MSVGFDVKLVGFDKIAARGDELTKVGKVWLANEALKDTDPYVPMLTGSLSQRSHLEGDQIVYPGPYARYLYYGKAMEGPRYGPKKATDKDLVYTKQAHPNAQSHWFEASKSQNLEKWLRGLRKIAKR